MLCGADLDNFIGVTLTLKQRVDNEVLTEYSCSSNLRHFLNVINKKVYKNGFTRYGKRLQIFPVLEKSLGDRLHYHLAIERPRDMDLHEFQNMIRSEWIETRFGHREIQIESSINQGWINYITKFRSYTDQVDWENVHLNR